MRDCTEIFHAVNVNVDVLTFLLGLGYRKLYNTF